MVLKNWRIVALQISFICMQCNPERITYDLDHDDVIQFEAVEFIAKSTMKELPQVQNVNLSFPQMYMHVFQILKLDNVNSISSVTYNGEELDGASLGIPYTELSKMYAPQILGKVIRFCRACYAAALTPKVAANAWVLALTACKGNCQYIYKKSTEKFRQLNANHTTGGLITFASRHQHGKILQDLGFKLRSCGGGRRNQTNYITECDWKAFSMGPILEQDICLYYLKK